MGTYNSAVITTAGQSLLARVIADSLPFYFTTAKTTEYVVPSGTSAASLTELPNIKQSEEITSATVTGTSQVSTSVRFDNTDITLTYSINTIGVYAKAGTDTEETLLAVITAQTADVMPSYSSTTPVAYVYSINLAITNVSTINIIVAPTGAPNYAEFNELGAEVETLDAEVQNARIGADGVTYPTLGDAIRTQNSNLKSHIINTNKVLKTETGSAVYEWEPGRIKTNVTTIDITDVDTSDADTWYHAVIPCTAGAVFHLTVESATSVARPYACVGAAGTRLAVYSANAIDADITMPTSTAYLIVNSRHKKGVVYGGNSRIGALETRVEQAYFPKGRLNNYPVDLDNVTDIGTYTILLNDPSTRYVNCPFDDGGMLIVTNGYGAFKSQIAISNSGTVYVRNYTSQWLNWTKLNGVYEDRFLYENLLSVFMTIGVVGDSLASGQGRVNDLNHYHDFYEYSWPQQLKRRLGNTVYNFTESSLSTRTWLTDADHGWALASDGQHNCQAYIIGLGANDVAIASQDASYIGSISDINVSDYTQNPDTYYGNYGRIISMLKTLEPRAKIFVVTNPAFGTQSIRDQLNAAVAEIAELFDDVYLVLLDETQYNTGFINANKIKSHYTPAAYLYMANILLNAISKIIYDNPADFFFVNLIGTDYATPVIT